VARGFYGREALAATDDGELFGEGVGLGGVCEDLCSE
jgi:hypothetical protein